MSLKTRLHEGDHMVGAFLSIAEPALAELLSDAVDLVIVDIEHGALGLREMQNIAIAARAGGAHVLARLPASNSDALNGVLDSGVDGIVAPRVESADQARRLVHRLRYPPDGSRGYGPRRANRYGRDPGPWQMPGMEPACVVQIETGAGVAAAAEIAAVDGVDALLLGAADLSFDLGHPLDSHHDAMREAIATVQTAAADAEIAFAFAGGPQLGDVALLIDERCTVLLHGTDLRIYAAAVDNVAGDARCVLRGLGASTGGVV